MKTFIYERAASFAEASKLKKQAANAALIAGGTDLLGVLKEEILPSQPDRIIDLKRIPAAKGVSMADGEMRIGALTTLASIAENADVKRLFPVLAQAARSVATPLIRSNATIGGNLCQDVRCWFYRYPHEAAGRLNCARKCGEQCYAVQGENRYHSIFGGYKIANSQCTMACPAGTDIPAYMAQLRKGNWDAAAEIIMRVNPMPMITSRICPHPCQDSCNQCSHGESVNIHCVERAVGDYILRNAGKFYTAPAAETGKRIAVIGAGPAGLTCAYYMRKMGHSVTVMDKMEKAGGVLMYGIPHYRLPKDIVQAYVDALATMGVEFKLGTEVGKDIEAEEIEAKYDNVFLGTGAWKQPILGIHGEELTQFGLNFLVEVNKYLKKVTSFGENILVCGGGNVAMDVALTAVRLGARNITLCCLEQEAEMPASREEIDRAKEEGVHIINGHGLSRILDDNGKVIGLETKRCVSVFDENGRFNPVYDEDDKQIIDADTIILATGQRVDLSFLGDRFAAEIGSERGLIGADDRTFRTTMPHIYGAGDAVTGPNIAIRAVHGGAAAARSMSRELGFPMEAVGYGNRILSYNPAGVAEKCSNKAKELPVCARTLEKEDSQSLSAGEAIAEANRCMDCGCYAVSPSDLAPALIALNAAVVTTERVMDAADLCCTSPRVTDTLHEGEIITEIRIPIQAGYQSAYKKFRLREAIDFAIVGVASSIQVVDGIVADAHLVFSGVSPMPRQALEVDAFLKGKRITPEVAEAAAKLAVRDAIALQYNAYKIVVLESLVKDAILAAG